MRNCGAIISDAIERKKVMKNDLARHIGIHPQNVNKLLEKSSFDSLQLERACELLELDPADFFDYRPHLTRDGINIGRIEQSPTIGSANVDFRKGDAELYERLLKEKDERIKALEAQIKLLRLISGLESNSDNREMQEIADA